jgi:hypothetical protein
MKTMREIKRAREKWWRELLASEGPIPSSAMRGFDLGVEAALRARHPSIETVGEA